MDKRVIKIKDFIKEKNKKTKEEVNKKLQRANRKLAFNSGNINKEEN
jgi:arginine repressor